MLQPVALGRERLCGRMHLRGGATGFRRANNFYRASYTGSATEYFTWLSAKLDSIEAMPSSRVSLVFRKAS